MTTDVQTTSPAASGAPAEASIFVRTLRSEWTKLRTVRSTMWSLALLVILTLGFTGLVTALVSSQWSTSDPGDRAQIVSDPTGMILASGFQLGQLTICVLGVMVITSEYSTGMIRASLLAVPQRLRMLAAKCVVFAVVVFVVGEIVAFACFALGAAILHGHAPVGLSDPGVLRAVVGAGLYLTVLGLFALSVGAIVRHTAAAITTVIGFVLVVAPLAQLLPGSFGNHVHAYLPTEAGHLIAQAHRDSGDLLGPWQGLGVFCLWTAVLLAIASYLLQRRDA